MALLTTELAIEDKELKIKGTHMAEMKEVVLLSRDNPPMLEDKAQVRKGLRPTEPMISREMLELLET